jgi:hypothetical protein
VTLMFTVDVALGREGRFGATCRELPGLFVSVAGDDAVLARAELEIRRRLRADRR